MTIEKEITLQNGIIIYGKCPPCGKLGELKVITCSNSCGHVYTFGNTKRVEVCKL